MHSRAMIIAGAITLRQEICTPGTYNLRMQISTSSTAGVQDLH
jgi:hypothetical protein